MLVWVKPRLRAPSPEHSLAPSFRPVGEPISHTITMSHRRSRFAFLTALRHLLTPSFFRRKSKKTDQASAAPAKMPRKTIDNQFAFVDHGAIHWTADFPARNNTPSILQPTILFIHAAITDMTVFEHQVEFLTQQGWVCLRYNQLGYGRSQPHGDWLKLPRPRPPVKHYEHAAAVVKDYLAKRSRKADQFGSPSTGKVIVVALSRGVEIAVDFALAYPGLVAGLVLVAGGVSGLAEPDNNTDMEKRLLANIDEMLRSRDERGLVNATRRFWADGPRYEPGRGPRHVQQALQTWLTDICYREILGEGGSVLECEELSPPAAGRMDQIKVPVAGAIGTYDETSTNDAMHWLCSHAYVMPFREFEAAHLVPLEQPRDFNNFLREYLEQFLPKIEDKAELERPKKTVDP